MITQFDYKKALKQNEFASESFEKMALELAELQRKCIEKNIPVLILIDGWESSGKGYVLNHIVRELDARALDVHVFRSATAEDHLHPFSWRFWTRLPAKGDFAIFDRSFYFHLFDNPDFSQELIKKKNGYFEQVERTLWDDGMILIKFFLQISEETQKERIEEQLKDKHEKFLVTKEDLRQNKNYKQYLHHIDYVLTISDTYFAPWQVISAEDKKLAAKEVMGLSIRAIQKGIARVESQEVGMKVWQRPPVIVPDLLQNLQTDLKLKSGEYNQVIEDLQKEAGQMLYYLHIENIRTVLVFEGMDAAGKGGAIKRLTKWMDPRFYEINPTSAPSISEKDHHYLWRFYNNFPVKGKMAIFDRSWYGRVMVERIEGFAYPAEWDRAYQEINAMEQELIESGTLIIKYFLYIDKDEQLARFEQRTREKPYKITDEDWRNREKWDEYLVAFNEMLDRTSAKKAPWVVVEGNDKKYARVKILKDFIKRSKNILK